MPSDDEELDELRIRANVEALDALPPPALEDDEAVALLDLFPTDDSTVYGVAWGLLHAVESAPGWPIALDDRSWWAKYLRERAERGGPL